MRPSIHINRFSLCLSHQSVTLIRDANRLSWMSRRDGHCLRAVVRWVAVAA